MPPPPVMDYDCAQCTAQRYPPPHGGTRRCRPTNTNGLPTRTVGRDLCVPPPVRTESYWTDRYVAQRRAGLAPAAGTGCDCAQCTAQRYPPPRGGTRRCRPTNTDGLPTRTVGRDRCVPPPVRTESHWTDRYVAQRRAGACPRRWSWVTIAPNAPHNNTRHRAAAHAGAALQIRKDCRQVT